MMTFLMAIAGLAFSTASVLVCVCFYLAGKIDQMDKQTVSLENGLRILTEGHYDLEREFYDHVTGAGNYDDDEPDSHRDRDPDDEWDDPFADADDDVLGPALEVQAAAAPA